MAAFSVQIATLKQEHRNASIVMMVSSYPHRMNFVESVIKVVQSALMMVLVAKNVWNAKKDSILVPKTNSASLVKMGAITAMMMVKEALIVKLVQKVSDSMQENVRTARQKHRLRNAVYATIKMFVYNVEVVFILTNQAVLLNAKNAVMN